MCGPRVLVAGISVSTRRPVRMPSVIGGVGRIVPLLLESQVDVPGAINVLHLLRVKLVLLDVVSIIVE